MTAIAVVIPAHNEAGTIATPIRAVDAAARACPLPVHLVVVADACTDDTAAAATSYDLRGSSLASFTVAACTARKVGEARRAGVATALKALPTDSTWIANTDADSAVPVNWLTRQPELAVDGVDVVAGTVQITDWSFTCGTARRSYQAAYDRPDPHGHIHAANFGIRADCYTAPGGSRRGEAAKTSLLGRPRFARSPVHTCSCCCSWGSISLTVFPAVFVSRFRRPGIGRRR